MKKKCIMEQKSKEIDELMDNFEASIFVTNEGCQFNGSLPGILSCICGAIEMVCEDVPREVVRECIEIAFHDEKGKDKLIKEAKEKRKKSKELKKVEKLLKEKSKKKNCGLDDLKEVVEALEELEKNK